MTDKTTVDARDRCHECGECPPSDDLRAAMEALRVGGNPTNNTIDDAYVGRMFDNCNAVLAAWDAQQGDGM